MEFDYYELMFIASCIADAKERTSHYYGIDKTYSRYNTEQKVRRLAKLIEDETYYVHMEKHIKPSNGKVVCQKKGFNYCDDSITLEGGSPEN